MEYHAFYSLIQEKISKNYYNFNKKNKIHTNFYKIKDSINLVETTVIYNIRTNPTPESCNILFKDVKYLGIVDMWIKIGKIN